MTEALRQDCSHCHLAVTPHSLRRTLNGTEQIFCCYGCCLAFQVSIGNTEESTVAWFLIRLGIGGFLAMNIMLFSLLLYSGTISDGEMSLLRIVNYLLWALATPVLIILGGPFFGDAWWALRNGRLGTDSLISVGVLAAYGYSVIVLINGGAEVYFDTTTMLLVLFTLGRYLEATGRAKATRSLELFFQAEDGWANVVNGEQESRCQVRNILPGQHVRIRPGDQICIDGVVVEGQSELDEAVITGESRWVGKGPGERVSAGSINQSGHLIIECSTSASESNWAIICQAARQSLVNKTHVQRIADGVAAIFVPAVFLLAGATIIYWSGQTDFGPSLLAGLSVLVVACPCALGLAAPLATTMGIGLLNRRGILIRSGDVLESLAAIKGIAFDKTGTITHGGVRLVRIECHGASESEILANAAALELGASHPFADAIEVVAAERQLAGATATNMQTLPRRGITGIITDRKTAVGNLELMVEFDWAIPPNLSSRAAREESAGRNIVWVGWSGDVRGFIVLEDRLDVHALSTIKTLRQHGLFTALLSGDRKAVAESMSGAVGFHTIESELTPDGKVEVLSAWTKIHGPIAMVGDGINDGPVLASAAVGIAVGGATDLARETADVVLPQHGLKHVPWLLRVAADVRRTIQINLVCAFGYNLVALTLAAMGIIQPLFAALLMIGSSILVVFNSLSLSRLADNNIDGKSGFLSNALFKRG